MTLCAQVNGIDTSASLAVTEKKLLLQIDAAVSTAYQDTSEPGLEQIFIQDLVRTLKTPASFSYPFAKLTSCSDTITKSCIKLEYSDDRMVRVFNWRSPTSGTMHHNPAVIQAKNKQGNILVYSSEDDLAPDGDIGGGTTYFKIFRLRETQRQLYITLGAGQGSGRLPYEIVEIFEVLSQGVSDSAAIIRDEGRLWASLVVNRESTRYDKDPQEIPPVQYDPKAQLLTIPEIVDSEQENEESRWNGKLIRFQFNGREFVRVSSKK